MSESVTHTAQSTKAASFSLTLVYMAAHTQSCHRLFGYSYLHFHNAFAWQLLPFHYIVHTQIVHCLFKGKENTLMLDKTLMIERSYTLIKNGWTLNKPMAVLSTCHLAFALDGNFA